MSLENTAVVEDSEEIVVTGRRGKPLDKYAARRIRSGKTRRDHESGAWKQRITNLSERAAWINDTRSKAYTAESSVPRMPKPHGNGNSSKRFKLKPAKRTKG